jgi:hypothetical protein
MRKQHIANGPKAISMGTDKKQWMVAQTVTESEIRVVQDVLHAELGQP